MTQELPEAMPVDLDGALALADRRDALCRLQPKCPACNNVQVQLVNAFNHPAIWKCRMCKELFTKDLQGPGATRDDVCQVIGQYYNSIVDGNWSICADALLEKFQIHRRPSPQDTTAEPPK